MQSYVSYSLELTKELNRCSFYKIEEYHEEVLKASRKLSLYIGSNRPMNELDSIVDAFNNLIEIIPSASINVTYFEEDTEDASFEKDNWNEATYAVISSENVSLKHKANGRFETMASDIANLIIGCMDHSEINFVAVDWDGPYRWHYVYKK